MGSGRPRAPVSSIAIGVLVFVIWIAPDLLWPGYRHYLENPITGKVKTSLTLTDQGSAVALALRTIRTTLIVPVVEELFYGAAGER